MPSGPARRGDGRGRVVVRALRLLPAGLPDLPGARRGDGLAARAHRADEGGARGRAAARRRRRCTSTAASGAWPARRRARRACATAISSSRCGSASRRRARPGGGRRRVPPAGRHGIAATGSGARCASAAWRARCPPCCPATLRRDARPAPGHESQRGPRPRPRRQPRAARRGRVALLTGCVQDVLRPSITAAAIRVLPREGVEVVVPGRPRLLRRAGRHIAASGPAASTWSTACRTAFPPTSTPSSSPPPGAGRG